MAGDGDTVVITGGNGFVGQHIIKLLHQHCQKEVKEIRVFDIKPYTQNLDFKPTIPVKSIQGDICNLQNFSRAVKGADCVIHVAGVISIGTHPDVKKMQAINVDVSVRPTGMYGELDVNFIALMIRSAASRGGVAVMIGPKDGEQGCIHDIAYVGNVAWAHICAMRTLRDKPEVCGGKPYFITDDTPRLDFANHCSPFLQARGYSLASFRIPFRLACFIIMILQTLLMLIKPIKTINLPVNLKILDYINYNYSFRRTKASKDLGYRPIFTHEESMKNAAEYYKTI